MYKKYKIYERDVQDDCKNIFHSSDRMYSVMGNLKSNNLIFDWMFDPIHYYLIVITDDLSHIDGMFMDKNSINRVF